jgi:pilus assembly protein CpaE
MPVIVDADSARASSLASSVGHGSHVVSTLEHLDSWLVRRPNEYAVLVGPEIDIEAAMAVADQLRLKRPGLGVLLLRHQVGTDLLTSAIRSGIREVLTIGDHESLRIAVERTRETFNAIHGPTASDANDGRVFTVFSPKGGVGKTTVAVNLALALSDNGTNRVCLVDLDLAFGDVAITLQLIPEHTISEAVEVEDHLDMSMLSNLLTRHDSGLHVLAAPTHPDAKDRISTKLVRRVLAALRSSFDYIVVDTSPGFDEQVLSAFDETDENVKMSMETLDLLNLATGHRYLVLNRADEEVGLTPANVETILKMGVTVQFPSSMDVANSTNHGRPIVLSKPDHRVSRAIRELGRRLSTEDSVSAPAAVSDEKKRGLFGRRRLEIA